jgi:hypothetical protein
VLFFFFFFVGIPVSQQSYPIAFYLLATAAVAPAVYIQLLVDVAKVICLCNEHSTQFPLHPTPAAINRSSSSAHQTQNKEFLWTRKREEHSSSYYHGMMVVVVGGVATAADFDDLTWTLCVPSYNAEGG